MSDLVSAIMATPFGRELNANEATSLVAAGKIRHLPSGGVLFEIGAPGDILYLMLAGSVQVMLGRPLSGATVVASLGPGQLIGEVEVMTRSLRVASVTATADTTLLELPAQKLEQLAAANNPVATKLLLMIARALARRLAAVNERLVDREKTGALSSSAAATSVGAAEQIPIDDEVLSVLDRVWS